MIPVYPDPEGEKRSLMHLQKVLCNGEENGVQCEHYWAQVRKMNVANSDALRHGEKSRFCMLTGEFLGDGGSEMRVYCNQYKTSTNKYDMTFEDFNPMTPEEIAALRVASGEAPMPLSEEVL